MVITGIMVTAIMAVGVGVIGAGVTITGIGAAAGIVVTTGDATPQA
jgi:hypothetical protein